MRAHARDASSFSSCAREVSGARRFGLHSATHRSTRTLSLSDILLSYSWQGWRLVAVELPTGGRRWRWWGDGTTAATARSSRRQELERVLPRCGQLRAVGSST